LFIYFLDDDRLQPLAANSLGSGKDIPGSIRNNMLETTNLYLKLYDWYYIPMSVHKILFQGAKIIESFIFIPIGPLSEEAQESCNKDLKHYREFNTRKCSRFNTNENLTHKLLISSDPYISNMRQKPKKTKLVIDPDAKNLLILSEE